MCNHLYSLLGPKQTYNHSVFADLDLISFKYTYVIPRTCICGKPECASVINLFKETDPIRHGFCCIPAIPKKLKREINKDTPKAEKRPKHLSWILTHLNV